MPLPVLLGVGAVRAGVRAIRGLKPSRQEEEKRRRRRRRARLTQSDRLELQWIVASLGRTAAANALPYYMGRGGG